ncbi:GAMM1 protein [Fomitiporia mediterranea MF3/22]|uniref:GAMM1 protein n=1 Tax=Fomitiporia mediterranea (strain MF3/22) TaxID=694068 RepID=UPI0004407704|nr:GAMM1 protein [Fomitiporia mediterranea MF3/22]EJC97963.1 GAMM1 protein [Fomitiporia mediterranea MF3/22]
MSANSAAQTEDRETKRARVDSAKVIGTHNGTFHCDEALACFLLKLTSTYRDARVVRSRDPKILDGCDIVVDVGGVYNDSKKRYDHHQRGFEDVFGHGFVTKLSSAGLVYKHYGKEIIASRLNVTPDSPVVDLLWLKMYKEFIEAIDGIDNGVTQYPKDSQAAYRNRTDLSSRVAWLNPAWNESADTTQMDALFAKASNMTGEEFLNRLDYYAKSWMPARDIVVAALSNRMTVHSSGRIVVFDQFAPWKEHLFDIEEEQNIPDTEKPFYILYPDETASNWRIQAVPISPDSFESRKALPQAWRGVRDDALSQLSGIPGCIFVHASGFIGGNATKEGVMAMAIAALQQNE